MNNQLFSIGRIAKIKGITIKALRFYERIGLLKPYFTDPITKYRYYSIEQFVQLDIIKASRSMQMSPKDIKSILDKKDTTILLNCMNSQKENALQKISELQKTIVMIEAAQGTIQSALSEVLNQDIFYKELPERYIITKKLGDKIDEQELLIDFTDFQNMIAKNKLIDTYETGYFYTTNENFEFRPVQIFNTVVIGTSSDTSIVSTIPAGKYLCICFNRQNTQEQLSKLNSYLKHNNINCSTVLQIELLDNVFEANNPFFELQLNIKER